MEQLYISLHLGGLEGPKCRAAPRIPVSWALCSQEEKAPCTEVALTKSASQRAAQLSEMNFPALSLENSFVLHQSSSKLGNFRPLFVDQACRNSLPQCWRISFLSTVAKSLPKTSNHIEALKKCARKHMWAQKERLKSWSVTVTGRIERLWDTSSVGGTRWPQPFLEDGQVAFPWHAPNWPQQPYAHTWWPAYRSWGPESRGSADGMCWGSEAQARNGFLPLQLSR